ncbi:hypothetical protein JHK82_053691 [Glycine max]|uniref:Uncharacterized protein n=1 Tax=Glycine max TaxID=3847 RepID=K7MYI0_SOYBN|nr:hypothetical protein JHK85_054487 [Glycine max]KAG5086294.1 hypothetical protein JHK82_053691 [Glycine max]KAH1077928.1 hypothetical protein GYH30_053130 [Glycine max]KRG95446.1 hypothetical protein GLYMA_19G151600v4 [Glycine max]
MSLLLLVDLTGGLLTTQDFVLGFYYCTLLWILLDSMQLYKNIFFLLYFYLCR